MKRFLLSMALTFGVAGSALAVPPCWPGSIVNVGPPQYLSAAYLSNWWNTHIIPFNTPNPHYYVAFHAAHEFCAVNYGSPNLTQITGPYSLVGTVNGTIWGGVNFQCRKCSGADEAEPGPIDPQDPLDPDPGQF
jgi:hypothetical protein